MSGEFVNPITIKSAINNIDDGTYLIPAIQRKFVWSSHQIEVLFDSIMRGYPINSFMFWDVRENTIKNGFKFYRFLTDFRQFFKEDNPDVNTTDYKDFKAVIDGQQRLTSLYIGLKGSYAYKMPRKWLYDKEENIPTRHLYLNLADPLPSDNDQQMHYDFRFLTNAEYRQKKIDSGAIWYKVGDILKVGERGELDKFIDSNGWLTMDFTKETLRRLHKVVYEDKAIIFYLETTQEIDTVLDIFIRTNSGGQPLSFSNLLMSITTAHWKTDARKAINDIVQRVFKIGNPGFQIDGDFVLKTCLVLLNDNIKFQVKNFDQHNVIKFEDNWTRIQDSVFEAFILLEKMGFNNQNLRAKNAVIPIIYYIYQRGIETTINNPVRFGDEKKKIRTWLCLSLLKGVFGSQGDTVLTGIRKSIKAELAMNTASTFPLERIRDDFKSNPAKNLSFDDDFIEGLLTTQKDEPDCFPALALIYSHLNFNQEFHKDHLHPENYFRKHKKTDYENESDYEFYNNSQNWNSILNLQLLNSSLNESKKDTPLKTWVNINCIDITNQLIPDVCLDIHNFREFIEKRKKMLVSILKTITG
jgi:uncharacterized protein with ParB-like and HNH nuclease domain